MTYKTLLVLLHGTDADRRVLDSALNLATRFGGRVEGMIVRPDPRETVQLATDGMSPAMIESIMAAGRAETEQRQTRARDAFAAACAQAGLEIDGGAAGAGWTEAIGDPAEHVARRGRVADVTILGHPAIEENESGYVEVEAGLFETGRPVLVVGADGFTDPTAPALVGWNGSAELARAVRAGLPLLQAARTVTVIGVDEPEGFTPGAADLCAYLARHDIECACDRDESGGRPIGIVLTERAERLNAGLLLMGAYGHSRLRELVLGGVTRRLLGNPNLTMLMAR